MAMTLCVFLSLVRREGKRPSGSKYLLPRVHRCVCRTVVRVFLVREKRGSSTLHHPRPSSGYLSFPIGHTLLPILSFPILSSKSSSGNQAENSKDSPNDRQTSFSMTTTGGQQTATPDSSSCRLLSSCFEDNGTLSHDSIQSQDLVMSPILLVPKSHFTSIISSYFPVREKRTASSCSQCVCDRGFDFRTAVIDVPFDGSKSRRRSRS